MRDGEFRDRRLVPIYDLAFPWSGQDDFFLAVVQEETADRVLDLGCGTGRLSLALSAAGFQVTGVDPARTSLDAARGKPGAADVTWLEGTSVDLPEDAFDVAVMTSHVAQFFVSDAEWTRGLSDLHRALVPGGRLVFDTRDPRGRGWERWNAVDTRRDVLLPDGRAVRMWSEVDDVHGGTVTSTQHYVFPGGEELLSTVSLRFRTEDEIRGSLSGAGFWIDAMYGGWRREPIGHPDGELLVLARRG
jgi:SAM-dependent methyltransferase